jgi:hypothetical protein
LTAARNKEMPHKRVRRLNNDQTFRFLPLPQPVISVKVMDPDERLGLKVR